MTVDGHRLIQANGTLVLPSVKAEDSGYYTCTATNTWGFDTIIINLLVQGEGHGGGRPAVPRRCPARTRAISQRSSSALLSAGAFLREGLSLAGRSRW